MDKTVAYTKPGKLDKSGVEYILALTPLQEGMLLDYMKAPGDDLYLEQVAVSFTAPLPPEKVEESWNRMARRHEMLRTLFRWEELKNPVQIALSDHQVNFQFTDLSTEPDPENSFEMQRLADRGRGFSLTEVPFRVNLFLMAPDCFRMLVSHHHILYDGWSNAVLLHDFFSDLAGRPNQNEKAAFGDFVRWQQQQQGPSHEKFWAGYLSGYHHARISPFSGDDGEELPATPFPEYRFHSASGLSNTINRFGREHKLTAATVFYTAWGILLQRYSYSADITFGTTVAGRNAPIRGIGQSVGLFINTVPLRIQSRPDSVISEVLAEVNRNLRQREAFEAASVIDIQRYAGIADRLFDTIVVIENYPTGRADGSMPGIRIDGIRSYEKNNQDITLSITLLPGEVEFSISYNARLFSAAFIQSMGGSLLEIVRFILASPNATLDQVAAIIPEERKKVTLDFNDTAAYFDKDMVLPVMIEEQCARTPDNMAVVAGNGSLTYAELNRKANALAHRMRKEGLKRDDVVAILLHRSTHMMVGMLAVLKAGAAYMPVDPLMPGSRIAFQLADSDARLVLTQESLKAQCGDYQRTIWTVDDPAIYEGPGQNPEPVNRPEDLAYLIYTSGTTGRPKGSMIEHRNVVNYVTWLTRTIPITAGQHFLMLIDFHFDPCVADIYGSLTTGATLHVSDKNLIYDRDAFFEYIRRNQIHILDGVPTLLKELLAAGERIDPLHTILVGSESLDNRLKDDMLSKGYTLFNHYGLTETTVDISVLKCSAARVTIGRPIANVRCYVLDHCMQPAGIGVPGELFVAGAGLGRGYLNLPELNSEKFIRHPSTGERIFRTGDKVRWLPDGQLDFLGRVDFQIKIRGYRVEPEEVAQVMLGMEHITGAVVLAAENTNGQGFLAAFYTSAVPVEEAVLLSRLRQVLPAYMVPESATRTDVFPMTQAGKINRSELLSLALENKKNRQVQLAPETPMEEKVAEVWKELLQTDKVGVNDSFFEIGGNSLLIIRLHTRLKKLLERDIPVVALFEYPTIRSFIQYMEGNEKSDTVDEEKRADSQEKGRSRLNQRRNLLKKGEDT